MLPLSGSRLMDTGRGAPTTLAALALRPDRPINAVVNFETRCNSRCVYCESWKHGQQGKSDVDLWLGVFGELAALGVREVIFSGGEPLLQPRLREAASRIAGLGMLAHLITNGVLLTERLGLELVDAGITGLTMSLDATDPRMYEATRGIPFERIRPALDVLSTLARSRPRLYISLNCVITRINCHALGDVVDEAERRGIFAGFQSYNWTPGKAAPGLKPETEDEERLTNEIEKLVARKERGAPISSSPAYLRGIPAFLCRRALPDGFRCLAGNVGVNLDGARRVRPCWSMEAVGCLDEKPLAEIWNSSEFAAIRSRMERAQCARCWLQCHADVRGICREERQ